MDQHSPAEELPALYRAILDRVAELERTGQRAKAARVRSTATRIYSRAWDDAARRESDGAPCASPRRRHPSRRSRPAASDPGGSPPPDRGDDVGCRRCHPPPMADETIHDLLERALDAYAALEALGEDVEDEWTYVTDLEAAWRERLLEVDRCARRRDRPRRPDRRRRRRHRRDRPDHGSASRHRLALDVPAGRSLVALGEPL